MTQVSHDSPVLIIEHIKSCMGVPATAKLSYRNNEGFIVDREVQPYSFSEDKLTLFGWCCAERHIKQFKVAKIEKVVMGTPFAPTRPIKIPG